MKIFSIALAIFVFTGFVAVVEEIGVFSGVYQHTSEQSYTVDSDDLDNIKKISGDDILSGDDFAQANPDTGGIGMLLNSLSSLIKILDMSLNVDKLILEFTPQSAVSVVTPIAGLFANVLQVVYIVGLLSFYRKYQVG